MTTALPIAFIDRFKNDFNQEILNVYLDNIQNTIVTSIVVNIYKFDYSLQLSIVNWSKSGYYLSNRPSFTLDPLLHAGVYYVQEASSMFVQHVAQHLKPMLPSSPFVLDLCAAPGGKTTAIIGALGTDCTVVANEINGLRSEILRENCIKYGTGNIIVTNTNAAEFEKIDQKFDFVLIDAPCSGEGMFRKDDKAIEDWSPNLVSICAARQKDIVDSAFNLIEKGAYIVYSTCTFNKEENEEIVSYLQHKGCSLVKIRIDDSWGIHSTTPGMYRFIPGMVEGEGFFCAVLRKDIDTAISNKKHKIDLSHISANKMEKEIIGKYIPSYLLENTYKDHMNKIYSINLAMAQFCSQATKQKLKIKYAGMCLGEIKGKDFIPDHAISLSAMKNTSNFEVIELDYNEAIAYLRRHEVKLNTTVIGWAIVSYEGYGLGFVKVLPNRINNYYPKNWEIRTTTELPIEDQKSIILKSSIV